VLVLPPSLHLASWQNSAANRLKLSQFVNETCNDVYQISSKLKYRGQLAGPYTAAQYGDGSVFTADGDGSAPNMMHADINTPDPSGATVDFGSEPHVLVLSVEYYSPDARSVLSNLSRPAPGCAQPPR
jgi:hypothetical protein